MKTNWIKKAACVFFCAALLLPLCGCGGRELYERLLIHGVGVDVNGDNFVVTVRSSVSPEDEGEEYFRCEGRTVLEALNSLSRSTGRQPFYAHNYLVVFGRECAQQGLDRCLDFFVRYYNTRPAVRMYLAEGKAEEILSFQKDGKYLRMSELQQLGDSSRDTGCTVKVDILDFINGVKRQGSSPVLPVLRASEEEVQIVSTAYFEGYTFKAALTPEETRGFLAVKDRLEHGEAVVEGKFGTATLSLSGASGSVKASAGENDRAEFDIQVNAHADLSALTGGWDRPSPSDYNALEAALAEVLEQEITDAVNRAVIQDRCDIFGFGALLYRRYPAYWKTISADWKEQMAQCCYHVSVTASVSRLEQEIGIPQL